MSADPPSPVVDLAREPAFVLSGLGVRPSTREVVAGDRRETLQPRVMQVLVVLARARGEVVSRDDLIQTCWGGRIVGEDAIDRTIANLRRLAEKLGGFTIETVPRVGYRLTPDAAGAQSPVGAAEVLLAVLPFENLSDDPQLSYFSDGVSEEILQTLAQRAGLKVIGRSSSFQLRGADKAIPNVAARLNATHVLDGAVRRSGQRTRISAQLIECATQTTVWADRFERELTDIFALQDEVATAVALALRHAFAPTAHKSRIDPITYDLYLRGSTMPSQMNLISVQSKVSLLEEAVAREPMFAEAWGRLGYARANLAFLLPGLQADAIRAHARLDAERALGLDPRCATAAVAMARTSPIFRGFLAQDGWLAKAEAWAPSDSFVTRFRALFTASVGRCRDAVSLMRQSTTLDPLSFSAINSLGSALRENGELEEAAAVFTDAVARWPEFTASALGLIFTLGFKGEFERARQVLERHELGPYRSGLTWFIDVLEEDTTASRMRPIAVLRRDVERTGRIGLDALMFAGHVGHADEALGLALGAEFGPPPDAPDPRGSDAFNPSVLFVVPMPEIRRDPRFVTVCATLGLVDYWLAKDLWPDCVEETEPYYDFKAECRRAADAARRRS